jgi:hypothetical protein
MENRLIIKPMPRPSLLEILSTWAPLEEEFPEIDDLEPIEDVDLSPLLTPPPVK